MTDRTIIQPAFVELQILEYQRASLRDIGTWRSAPPRVIPVDRILEVWQYNDSGLPPPQPVVWMQVRASGATASLITVAGTYEQWHWLLRAMTIDMAPKPAAKKDEESAQRSELSKEEQIAERVIRHLPPSWRAYFESVRTDAAAQLALEVDRRNIAKLNPVPDYVCRAAANALLPSWPLPLPLPEYPKDEKGP